MDPQDLRAPARTLAHHAVLLALCVAIAGCADVASPPAAATPDTPVADATDNTLEPGAMEPGLGSHAHDYWAGSERVTLIDEEIAIEPMDVPVWGVMSTRIFGDPSFGGAFIDLPEGSLVYEGTGRVEIVATWSDPTITGLRFVHRNAGSGEISQWIQTPSGETVGIDVTPDMTDMPHAQTSRWGFLFAASGTPAVATGTFHIRIEIVKTRDVAEWPAHPDHWKGRDEITLADTEATSPQRIGPELLIDPWSEPEGAIPSSAIVPMEAANLRVVVTLISLNDPAELAQLYLLLRTADDILIDFDDAGEPTQISDDGLTWTWELPIEMSETDNPYASESAWAFRVRSGVEAAPDLPFCEHGCYEGETKYRLVASVHKATESF